MTEDSSEVASPAPAATTSTLPPDFPFVPIGHPDTMMSKESVRRAVEEFQVRPTDIIVATFSKTGTTLVTWICHLLRTKTEFDFTNSSIETLYEVVPWPLLSYDIGYDPNTIANQFFPRVFKSHLRMASVYRGCKYIVTVRDPAKTTISFYNFLLAKQVPMVLNLEDVSSFLLNTPFVKGREGRASLWDYYQEYHLLRECRSVLIVVYEDLVKNTPKWIHAISQFMGIEATPELIEKVTQQSTKQHMAQYMTLFDEPYERAKQLGRVGDLSQLAPGAKVAVNPHPQQLNATALQFLQDEWSQTMKPLGYEDYSSFAAGMKQRNETILGVTL